MLRRIPVPPGPAGVDALIEPVRAALDGRGPAIAPVPVTSVTVSADYVGRLLRALRPDDPDAPLESDDIAVVLATSGSTGDPRGVLHTAASLTAMTDAVQGGENPQWIIALPVTSMGGFNVLVRALATDRSPIALASIGGAQPFTPADFASAINRAAADDIRVSLVAAQVRRLLGDDAGIEAMRACRQVLVGGGPAPDSLVESAHALGITLTRTYGATETAGGCVYEGRALPGVTVRIDDGDPGHVVIDGPMLALGYRCDPARTAERFTPDGYRTGDLGTMRDGRLVLQGRIDDVIAISGINVSPGAVERVIAECPDVAGCAVIALPGAEPELAAILVVRDGAPAGLRERLIDDVARELGRIAVPRRFGIVAQLPLLPNGKLDRARLLREAQEGGIAWHG